MESQSHDQKAHLCTDLQADIPYDPTGRKTTLAFRDEATPHTGIAELRLKRGHPLKNDTDRKPPV
jgi:hypothetical protein